MRKQGYAIGEDCYVDRRAVIDVRSQLVSIGSHCSIGAFATILTHDGFAANLTQRIRTEPVRILDGCSIGAGAVILPGVTIGPGSVVEPGAVVAKDVPPYTVVAGAPAKAVSSTWEWLEERQCEHERHPEQFFREARLRPFPLPMREAVTQGRCG
jgi:maltose O-acetyltransferase